MNSSHERPCVLLLTEPEVDSPPGLEGLTDRAALVTATGKDELEERIGDAEIVFAWRTSAQTLRAAWPRPKRLRWIQWHAAGVEHLLFPELVASDVVVTNASGVYSDGMAEYVLGLMLAFAKGLPDTLDRQRAGVWESRGTERLAGKRVLVAGIGSIGRALAPAARALGMHVRALGRTGRSGDPDFAEILGAAELPNAVADADYVVNALPATPETRRLFGAAVFARMKPAARFINVGRGWTVDEEALVEALRAGRIGAAALDVFEEEPLPLTSPLWTLPNVIVSPHMSGDAEGWPEALVALFIDNLDRYLRGDPLRNVVDKRLGYVGSG